MYEIDEDLYFDNIDIEISLEKIIQYGKKIDQRVTPRFIELFVNT